MPLSALDYLQFGLMRFCDGSGGVELAAAVLATAAVVIPPAMTGP